MTKRKPESEKKRSGPKTKYSEKIHSDIVASHQRGLNVQEVCHQVGIAKQTYYIWLGLYPKLNDDIQRAKTLLVRKSKELIMKAIQDGDIATGKWYLERKSRAEFATQQNNKVDISPSPVTLVRFVDDGSRSTDT